MSTEGSAQESATVDTSAKGPPGVTDQDGQPSAADGNKFQQAISAWRSLNLTQLVPSLDEAASQLVEHQKESVAQRKDLAQKTKDFRKLDDAGKLVEIKALLKTYQNYIDLLTNQSKTVSSAFLSAYTPLSEAPDPYPLLEASVESLVTSEELVPRLETENTHLQKTVTKLSAQLEDAEAQLDKERTSRQSIETNQGSKAKQIEESWREVVREKEENWSAREKGLEEKVENQERLLKELKASYEVTQRLEKAGEDSEAAHSRGVNAEIQSLTSELERATIRISEVEGRNEHLRVELAQASVNAGQAVNAEDDPAFLRLRSENTTLLRKLEAARFDSGSEQGKFESKIRSLEREISALGDDRTNLQARLDKQKDYDEIKQELDMIRTIEFSTEYDAEESGETSTNGDTKSSSLEQLLLARNKKLSDETTELRISQRALQSQLESLQDAFSAANMDLEKSRNLNAQLENDLTEAQQHVSNFDTMSFAGTYTSRYPKSSYAASRRVGGTSPTSSIISGFDGGRGSISSLSPSTPSSNSILPMITAQRDRFKKKLTDLETELQKSYTTITSLRSEVSSLQKDNLQLYEKTRYINSYARPNATLPVTSNAATSSGLSLDGRYRSAYEDNLSPFAAFRSRESARVLRRMTLPERAFYAIARTVLATRLSRNLFALYCVALHALVLYVLWGMGSADTLGHAVAGAATVGRAAGPNDGGKWLAEEPNG